MTVIDNETKKPIQLFLVEDHPSLRESLSMYFGIQADIQLCGTAETGEEALELIESCSPNLALVDLSLPGMSGIECISALRRTRPEITCVILSGHKEHQYGRQALAAGASGYILKGNPGEIVGCLRKAAAGGQCFAEELEVETGENAGQ